jgi:UDP-N-acetylmuramyl pentapeptide phosphotransferase/UDP-N-acetylglucosamine-1-phosphate transferase
LLASRAAKRVLDHPNARSLHAQPVPRIGGIALILGTVAAAALLRTFPDWLAIALALGVVSFVDDMRGLPVVVRLLSHLAAAVAFVALLPVKVDWPLASLLVLGSVWMINLYNFMDGSDGLAGGMAAIGFACYGAAAWSAGAHEFALLTFSVTAASLGFLVFNFPPARVFLGDAGSIPLGFLAAAVGIVGWIVYGLWPYWFPALVFSPFAVDATVTLLKRAARREAVWRAHREHYYQKLVRLGWGHRRTALAEYALMVACGLAALFAREGSQVTQIVVLCAAAAIYLAAMIAIDRAWRASQAGAAHA